MRTYGGWWNIHSSKDTIIVRLFFVVEVQGSIISWTVRDEVWYDFRLKIINILWFLIDVEVLHSHFGVYYKHANHPVVIRLTRM